MRSSLFIVTVLGVFAVICADSVPSAHQQCESYGHLGACNVGKLSSVYRNRCVNLRCATQAKVGILHDSQYVGKPALPGTVCGVGRVCDTQQQCVPSENIPLQSGGAGFYRCKPAAQGPTS